MRYSPNKSHLPFFKNQKGQKKLLLNFESLNFGNQIEMNNFENVQLSASKRPILLPDEIELLMQGGLGIYEG